MATNATIQRTYRPHPGRWTERMQIRGFASRDAMHKFLATGGNALTWKESTLGLRPGTYAFAGGRWHNVKSLDACTLAHV